MGDLYWLPVLCVVVYSVADPLGLGSIPFLYSAEFFPTEMRSILSGVTAGLSNLEMFLVVKVKVCLHRNLFTFKNCLLFEVRLFLLIWSFYSSRRSPR